MAMPNLIICSADGVVQSNYRNYATPKVRRSSHSIQMCSELQLAMPNLIICSIGFTAQSNN